MCLVSNERRENALDDEQGRRNVFSLGGGGGAKTKQGTVMSERALTVYMRITATNALMKHHCRHKVSFYMLMRSFLASHKNKNKRALQAQEFWILSNKIRVLL